MLAWCTGATPQMCRRTVRQLIDRKRSPQQSDRLSMCVCRCQVSARCGMRGAALPLQHHGMTGGLWRGHVCGCFASNTQLCCPSQLVQARRTAAWYAAPVSSASSLQVCQQSRMEQTGCCWLDHLRCRSHAYDSTSRWLTAAMRMVTAHLRFHVMCILDCRILMPQRSCCESIAVCTCRKVVLRAQVRGWQTVPWCSCDADVPDRLHTTVATAHDGRARHQETPPTDYASYTAQDGGDDTD